MRNVYTKVRGYIASKNSRNEIQLRQAQIELSESYFTRTVSLAKVSTPQMERGSGIFAAMYPRIWVYLLALVIAFFVEVRVSAENTESGLYPWPREIEEQVRAEDDPNYWDYVQEKKLDKTRQKKLAVESKKVKLKEIKSDQKIRKAYIKWRDKQPVEKNEAHLKALHDAEIEKYDIWQEKMRKKRVLFVRNEEEKVNLRRIQNLSRFKIKLNNDPQRLPANIDLQKKPRTRRK